MGSRWEEGEVAAGGTRIHYRRTGGSGKPSLVLVHGFTDDGLCWTPVARGLEDEYDIVMPDMAGHGLSSRASELKRLDMAADLASLIGALGLERPAIVGHSMGAMVAAQAVSRYPGLARALALEDPPWFPPSSPPPGTGAEGGEPPIIAWAKTLRFADRDELLAGYRRDHPSWPEDLATAMSDSKKRLDPEIIDALGDAVAAGGSAWASVLSAIKAPLLIFTADPALGAIVGPEVVAGIRGIRPDAEIAPIPGAGHLIRFDAHEAFMRRLRDFLSRSGR